MYVPARGARRGGAPGNEALGAIELFPVPRLRLADVLQNPPPDTGIDVKLFSLLWFLDVPR